MRDQGRKRGRGIERDKEGRGIMDKIQREISRKREGRNKESFKDNVERERFQGKKGGKKKKETDRDWQTIIGEAEEKKEKLIEHVGRRISK